MTEERYHQKITDIVRRLVDHAYFELNSYKVNVRLRSSKAFALVRWDRQKETINITLDKHVRDWHDAQLTGLVAHEFSHVILGPRSSEESVDRDVIKRKLGVYLAIERIMSGRHEDQVVARGRDRYLGYRTIREALDESEIEHLDRLLVHLAVYPRARTFKSEYEIAIVDQHNKTQLIINGHAFTVALIPHDADIGLIQKDDLICLVVNGKVISCINNTTGQNRDGLQ